MKKVLQLLMFLMLLIFLFSAPSSAAYFDFNPDQWIIHDDAANQEAIEELVSRQDTEGFKPFANAPAYPFGGQQNVGEATWPASMRKGMTLAMPQDVKDWFKTPAFDYSAGKHSVSEDLPGNVGYVTTQQEMLDWFAALPKTRMKYELITGFPYFTGNGYSDYALARTFELIFSVFSIPSVFTPEEVKALGKPVVWLHGSIHGGETAPGEALLQLAKEFANGEHDDILNKVTVIIVPRFNVDGAWNNQRQTTGTAPFGHAGQSSAGMDMNRDFVAFEAPIVRAIRQLQIAYDPIVSYCGHQQGYTWDAEYAKTADGTMVANGYRRGYDAILNTSMTYNLNVDRRVRDLGFHLYEPATKKALEAKGLEWGRYVGGSISATNWSETFPQSVISLNEVVSSDGVSGPLSGEIRYATGYTDFALVPEEGIGINGTALGNQSIVFVYEVASISVRLDYLRRVYAQYVGALEICRTAAGYLGQIIPAINAARAAEIARTEPLSFWGRPLDPEDVERNVLEYKGWKKEDAPEVVNSIAPGKRPIKWILAHYAERDATAQVSRPVAYIIPKENYEAAIRLFYSGVKLERLSRDQSIPVEAYTVTSTGANNLSPSGATSQVSSAIRSVTKTTKTISFPKDSFVVRMNQLGASLAGLALEPMAIRNYGNMYLSRSPSTTVPTWYRDTFLPVSTDQEYPCYRYLSATALDTYPANMNLPFMLTMVEKVHALTQEEIAEMKADLGLTADPEYVSKFQLPALSTDVSYKNMANVDLNEAFMLPDGTVVKIEPQNILDGNIVKLVAPTGLNGSLIFIGNKSGGYDEVHLKLVTKVTVDPKEMAVNVGNTKSLSVTVEPDDAADKSVIWSSNNEAVATVSSNGTVTGVSVGTAIITASSSSDTTVKDTCTVTVNSATAISVTISPKPASVTINGTVSLSADVLPADTTDKTVTWSSSNELVATVSADGTVTGISLGTATITARSNSDANAFDTCVITVNEGYFVPVSLVAITPKPASVMVNETISLSADITPVNATNKTVTWSSSNISVAIVDANGVVTGESVGTATITARSNSNSTAFDTCVVTVNSFEIPVSSITIAPKPASVTVKGTVSLSAEVLPENATDTTVVWSSSNTSVATVNSTGEVTGVSEGTAMITAKSSSDITVTDTCEVTVKAAPLITITTHPQDANVKEGSISGNLSVSATINPDVATLTYQWYYNDVNSSTNGQVIGGATIANYAIPIELLEGIYFYYCVVGAMGSTDAVSVASNTAKVTVAAANVNVTGVEIEPKSATLEIGNTLALTAKVTPPDAANPAVGWNSDDDDVATVDLNGVVTALSGGTTYITVMTLDGGFMDTCTITVLAATPVDPQFPSDKNEVADETGISPDDLEEKDGKVYLKKKAAEEIAKILLGAKEVNTYILPVFTAAVSNGGVAEVTFSVTGKDLLASYPDEINLIGLIFGGGGELFEYVSDAGRYGNGKFTLLLDGEIFDGKIDPDGIYELVVFIKDGDIFDLDGKVNGNVISSIFLASIKQGSGGGGGSGGCSAYGYLAFALFVIAPFVLRRK